MIFKKMYLFYFIFGSNIITLNGYKIDVLRNVNNLMKKINTEGHYHYKPSVLGAFIVFSNIQTVLPPKIDNIK